MPQEMKYWPFQVTVYLYTTLYRDNYQTTFTPEEMVTMYHSVESASSK